MLLASSIVRDAGDDAAGAMSAMRRGVAVASVLSALLSVRMIIYAWLYYG